MKLFSVLRKTNLLYKRAGCNQFMFNFRVGVDKNNLDSEKAVLIIGKL